MGKLYNKYRNWKKSVHRRALNLDEQSQTSTSKKAKQSSFEVAEDEDVHVRALKHDFHAMAYAEKEMHWKACAATRMNSIRGIENSRKHIIDIWPHYKSPDGFRLVQIKYYFP